MVASAQAQLFSDHFTRETDPGPLAPWLVTQQTNWIVTGGVIKGGTNPLQSYGYAYITNNWVNYSVQASFQFPVGVFGGGLGGRLNPITGAHYAAWIYPEGSPGGSNVLKLVKFQTWTTFGYTNSSYTPMQEVDLAIVGTNFHTLKLTFQTNRITVLYDTNQVMTVTDVEAQPYPGGGVSLDMWTYTIGYSMSVDDVLVTESPPTANNDSFSALSGLTLSIPAPGVLTNDLAGSSSNLTAVLATGPAHGSLVLNSNGSFTYTATNNFTGTDTFTYRANDGVSNSSLATVTITVTADHAPVANNDTYFTVSNSTLTVSAPGVLANDSDADGNVLTSVLVTPPTNGAFSFNANGSFTYTPPPNFVGTNTFTYRANDGASNSAIATAVICVLSNTPLFYDDFSRATDPAPLSLPWVAQSGNWSLTGGALKGGTNNLMSYGFAYLTNTWTNYSVQARIRFQTNAFGGGLGLCLNPITGSHYGAWIYPENSAGGSNVLKLVKFQNWTTFGYSGTNSVPILQTNLASVGTNSHTLKLSFQTNQLTLSFDDAQLINFTDLEAQSYPYGAISADIWTDSAGYNMFVEDVLVLKIGGDEILARAVPIVIQSIGVSNALATLKWSAVSNHTYRLQYRNSLTNNTWNDLLPDVLATSFLASATNSITGLSQRFYRVLFVQ